MSVHPRERGEHTAGYSWANIHAGSSPRARGTPGRGRVRPPVSAVHPRERGEHSPIHRFFINVSGSSPRARGTRPGDRRAEAYGRFIPASAGNTCCAMASTARLTVHPRERGEHRRQAVPGVQLCGSSPRARGTPLRDGDGHSGARFIPASAGNTSSPSSPTSASAVHPRERGEHSIVSERKRLQGGSSPRARGTLTGGSAGSTGKRFIPASAGNTSPAPVVFNRPPVHPRERGEHIAVEPVGWGDYGSSPRARGTLTPREHICGEFRFIPASAGNTTCSCSTSTAATVHPRERGEHPRRLRHPHRGAGSSPRARGTPRTWPNKGLWRRFIPASAGNTPSPATPTADRSVHPRERGEHGRATGGRGRDSGSSPRARGTLRHSCRRHRPRRFIPASAGNTRPQARRCGGLPVHPRERGEHGGGFELGLVGGGSSPRARGTHLPFQVSALSIRFIPASAGNTVGHQGDDVVHAVHPRERGEHLDARRGRDSDVGSSPRARGTHFFQHLDSKRESSTAPIHQIFRPIQTCQIVKDHPTSARGEN